MVFFELRGTKAQNLFTPRVKDGVAVIQSTLPLLDFLKVVRKVFWSGVVGPGTNDVELSLARSLALRARRSYDRAWRSLSRYALKSSTCEQVYPIVDTPL